MTQLRKYKGFTTIELMIVVVIVAILASVAYPAYLNSVRKARRADGQAAITNLQLAQQKLRSNCRFYGGGLAAANNCGASAGASTVMGGAVSPDGHYQLAISNASGTGYTITATGQGDQANDEDGGVVCTLVLTVDAANPNGVRTPADCWN